MYWVFKDGRKRNGKGVERIFGIGFEDAILTLRGHAGGEEGRMGGKVKFFGLEGGGDGSWTEAGLREARPGRIEDTRVGEKGTGPGLKDVEDKGGDGEIAGLGRIVGSGECSIMPKILGCKMNNGRLESKQSYS